VLAIANPPGRLQSLYDQRADLAGFAPNSYAPALDLRPEIAAPHC